MCALFLLWCSNAFYNLKVYVIQNGGEKMKTCKKRYQYLSWCFIIIFSWGDNVLKLGTLNILVQFYVVLFYFKYFTK